MSDNWSDQYVGKAWTEIENCYFWSALMIEDNTDWKLPLVEGLSKYQRARALLKEEKRNWFDVTERASLKNFDIVLMRHIGSMKDAHHLGVWTEANRGCVVHAYEGAFVGLDNPIQLALSGYEMKRVIRHV